MSAGSARCRTCKEASRRSAGIARKCSAQPATCLSSCLIHRRPAPFISGHPGRIRAGRARWRTVVNAGAHCWKACWVQALASSNLASSATSDQAIHKPRSCVRPGLARLHSLICSLIYSTHIGIKRPKVQAHASECYRGCGRPLGVPALSDQLAAVAVTMGERLGSDGARCSTQIDAPMSVKGSDDVLVFISGVHWNGVLAAGCGQDREGPLRVEGRLLLGHAGSGSGWTGGGRQIDRRPARGCGSRLEGQAVPGVRWAVSQRRRGGGNRPRGRHTVSGSA